MFKYFAWKERGYWRGQKLVPVTSIPSMRVAVGQVPSFASLQTYNRDGQVMFCPVYADLDGKDPKQAQHDAQYIVYLLAQLTNVVPDIYYSGNKGYHIIIPHRIEHVQCHLVAKYFFEFIAKGLPTLDKSVYRTQALLRLPGSPASRAGYYKVQITKDELNCLSHKDIEALATTPRIGAINEFDAGKINDEFTDIIDAGKRQIPVWDGRSIGQYMATIGEEMTPCLEKMLDQPTEKGSRNKIVFLLGRLFKKCGFTEAETAALMLSRSHFQDFETTERGVSSVLTSLFKSNKPVMIGCKNGADAELMQSFCDPLCHFNETAFQIFDKAV